MPLMTWQLWFAKDLVTQYRLPWQSATVKLSPGRVAQSMLALAEFVRAGSPLMERTQALIGICTPAEPPQSRGKSNGRAKGLKCTPRTCYPVARKTYSRPKKPQKSKTAVVA